MKMTRSIAFLAALMAFGPAHADDTFSCLDELTGPQRTVTGTEYVNNDWFWLEEGTRLDARGATFLAQTAPQLPDGSFTDYPLDIRSDLKRACWAGGAVNFTNDPSLTWAESKTINSAAIMGQYTHLTVDGIRIHNAHDAFRPYGADIFWQIRNSWVTYNRDDCIDDGWYAGGLVEDSLFDGCYVFLATRGAAVESPNVVTVRNSLIRMQKMPGPYGHENEPDLMAHGDIFKTAGNVYGPGIVLENNIFLVEGYGATKSDPSFWPAQSVNSLSLGQDKLKSCVDNVIVWLGPGDYPGDIPADPACVTVTKDRTVWDKARDQWLINHPDVARISGVDDPVVVVTDPGSTTPDDPISDPASGDDIDPPSVAFLSPANLVQRKSDQIIEVAATDSSGILRVEISIDGYPYAVLEDSWLVNWSVPANPTGSYEISATAIDLAGNHSTQSIRVFATR